MTTTTGPRTQHAVDAPPPTRSKLPPWRVRVPAVATLVVLLAVAFAATLSLRTPAPAPSSAPAAAFSADRAAADLPGIASQPHPAGSAANAEVAGYLQGRLRQLGLQPQVIARLASFVRDDGSALAGSVRDIFATVRNGTAPTGTILLVAHYDSVPIGPGASDDGANVAAILEIARALLAGPQPKNRIAVLFTDGEEHGMLGARAFLDSGVGGDPSHVVVLNMEARGVSGPAIMFQQAGDGLESALQGSGAFASSASDAVYAALPNDTDLSALAEGGYRGLNFAFVGGAAHYHTPTDDIADVDRGSVQDMGAAVLSVARALSDQDLTTDASHGDPTQLSSGHTYFTAFGTLVSYPVAALPLSLAAVVGFGLLLILGRRRMSARGVAWSAVTFTVVPVAAMAIGVLTWLAARTIRPDFALDPGSVRHVTGYAVFETLVLLVVVVGWSRLARRRSGVVESAAGVVAWFAVLAVVASVVSPGAAYLFTWPALVGCAGLAVATRVPAGSPWRPVLASAAGLPATILVVPVAVLLVPTLGLPLAGIPIFVLGLVAGTLMPTLEPVARRRRRVTVAMCTAAALAFVLLVGYAVVDRPGASDPEPVSLGYLHDADTGTTSWISLGTIAQPDVGRLLTESGAAARAADPLLATLPVSSGPAPDYTGPVPTLADMRSTEADGLRTIRAHLDVPAGAYRVDVYIGSGQDLADVRVNGVAMHKPGSGDGSFGAGGAWGWWLTYAAPPPSGLDLEVQVAAGAGSGTVPIRFVSMSAGLPAAAPALPADVTTAAWPPAVADETLIVRTYRI